MQAYDQRETQRTLDGFLAFNQRFAKIKSKRMQKAVSAIRGSKNLEILMADGESDDEPPIKKPRKHAAKHKAIMQGE